MPAAPLVFAVIVFAATASAAESPVAQAALQVERKASAASPSLALQFRLRAARALRERYPDLVRQFIDAARQNSRASRNWMSDSTFQLLAELSPPDALSVFREVAATFADPPDPSDALWLVMNAPPDAAPDSYERVIRAASGSDYAGDSKPQMIATFQIGSAAINTDNSRDTLLLFAGTRLRTLAPARFEKFKNSFARWTIDGPVVLKNLSFKREPAPASPSEPAGISERIATMRKLPTDADRARLVLDLVRDIKACPPGARKLSLISSLANLSTEGDLGKPALAAVASTWAATLRENESGASGDDYIRLATLVRYEHLEVPHDAPFEAAQALLGLREQLQQEAGFTLTGMDGQTYTLASLKGRIVLLNFWATWCPPCRKEMPDMENLYRTYEKKGLTVIAASDENRPVVEQFLAKNPYSFTVALDAGGKVQAAFGVDGIPKSFIFDREGRLAAQAIDMRTQSQFLELLKMAGLE
jgi:peroxiredoxin